MTESKEFLAAEQALARIEPAKHSYRVSKKLRKLRTENAERWASESEAIAQKATEDTPGAAIVLYLNAAKLARQNGDTSRADDLTAKAKELRAKVIDDFTYEVHLAQARGEIAQDVFENMASRFSRNRYRGVEQKTPRTDVTLELRTRSPSYNKTVTTEGDTFAYTARVKRVPNPERKKIEAAVELNRGNYLRCSKACSQTNMCCLLKYSDGRTEQICNEQCRVANDSETLLKTFTAQLASTPTTIEEPVKANQSYSYKLLAHRGTVPTSAVFEHADGRDDVKIDEAFERTIGERNHDAVSYKDGGVGAKRGTMPKQSRVRQALVDSMVSLLFSRLEESYEAYVQQLRDAGSMSSEEDKRQRAHGIITAYLLTGKTKNPDHVKEALGLPDAWEMIKSIEK